MTPPMPSTSLQPIPRDKRNAAEHLRSHVESMIAAGRFAPGDRLPPIRTLAEQFSLPPSTARRVIRELCDKGLLTLRHGSGTYVRDRGEKNDGRKTVAVVLWTEDKISSYCVHAASGMIDAAENSEYLLRFYYVPYYDYTRTLDLPEEIWDCNAVAFLGVYDSFELRNFRGNRPCVGLEMHRSLQGVVSPVSIDPYAAAELAVEFFRNCGVRTVSVSTMFTPLHRARANAFIDLWRQYGHYRTVASHKELPDHPPEDTEGIFFSSGTDHNFFLTLLKKKYGIPPAPDRMISIDGKSLLLPGYEPANTIYIDWQLAGRVVFAECRRRLETPGADVRRIGLMPRLHLLPSTPEGTTR